MFLKFNAGGGQDFAEAQVGDFFLEIDLPQRKISSNARLPQSWQPTIMFHNFLRRGARMSFGK